MGRGEIGPQIGRALVACDCSVEVALLAQRITQGEVRFRVAWVLACRRHGRRAGMAGAPAREQAHGIRARARPSGGATPYA